jgi:hypothetical protein
MEEVIRQAIRAKRLLTVCHHQGTHVVEPYTLSPTQDATLLLEGRLVEGEDEQTLPPQWCCMPLAEITAVTLLPHVFLPHPAYEPHSSRDQRAMSPCEPARSRAWRVSHLSGRAACLGGPLGPHL